MFVSGEISFFEGFLKIISFNCFYFFSVSHTNQSDCSVISADIFEKFWWIMTYSRGQSCQWTVRSGLLFERNAWRIWEKENGQLRSLEVLTLTRWNYHPKLNNFSQKRSFVMKMSITTLWLNLFSPDEINLWTSRRHHTASNAFLTSKHNKPTISDHCKASPVCWVSSKRLFVVQPWFL